MEHYNLKIKGNFNNEKFEEEILKAIDIISSRNGIETSEFNLIEYNPSKGLNKDKGQFKIYKIKKNKITFGFLECFKSDDNSLIIIYTSPTNSKYF